MTGETGTLQSIVVGRRFLEGPRWHLDRIWASDLYAGEVISARADGSEVRVEARIDGRPSGLGFLPDDRLLVVVMDRRRVLRRESSGELVVHAETAAELGHLNDMVTDRDGTAYVGAVGFDPTSGTTTMRPGSILRIAPDGQVTVAARDLLFPNGMVITPERSLVVAESFGNRLTTFDLGVDGSLTARRPWATFGPPPATFEIPDFLPALAVTPDGICLDAEGAVWVADPERRRVLRVDAAGAVVAEISGEDKIFAAALGGVDGRTLFLCAAPSSRPADRLAAYEGRLLAVPVSVPAFPA